MKKKKWLILTALILAVGVLGFFVCRAIRPVGGKKSPVTIVFTNDIHSYIYNTEPDEDGNDGPGLRLSNIAAFVKDRKAAGENVLLVDAGDEIQGCIYGSEDQGDSVLSIMNAAGYDLACPGNHDFDYGVARLLELSKQADFPYLCCNFVHAKSGKRVFPDYEVRKIGGVRIAFVGITTPGTLTTSTPAYFQDENGEYRYQFIGSADAEAFYACVQHSIDAARRRADYVIALGHVGSGNAERNDGISSLDVIENTAGLDVFLDGHSHTVMSGEAVKNRDGEEVLLAQTGAYLSAFGVLNIAPDGSIRVELQDGYEGRDETVAAMEQELADRVEAVLGQTIAELKQPIYISDPENLTRRLVRAQEMNSGDLMADSLYWYFNQKLDMPCDIALVNGGGIRINMTERDVTGMDVRNMEPFGNQTCMVSLTGQQILDALEMGVTVAGQWDELWDGPAENGGFLQVAGMRYSIRSDVPTGVQTDENGMFAFVDGDYRVSDVQVYNRESKCYEPLELTSSYNVAGSNYILRNSGNGLSMLAQHTLVVDYAGQAADLLAAYLENFASDGGLPVICTENSPLAEYEGYLLDYENPFGAGRILITAE